MEFSQTLPQSSRSSDRRFFSPRQKPLLPKKWLSHRQRLLPFNRAVVSAFIVAVLLHTSWDVLGTITKRTSIGAVAADYGGLFVVALVSLLLLTRRINQALSNQPKGEEPAGLK